MQKCHTLHVVNDPPVCSHMAGCMHVYMYAAIYGKILSNQSRAKVSAKATDTSALCINSQNIHLDNVTKALRQAYSVLYVTSRRMHTAPGLPKLNSQRRGTI